LRLRAVAELQSGQTEKSFDDIKLTLRLTESIHSEPTLISQLVRIAMLQIIFANRSGKVWPIINGQMLTRCFSKPTWQTGFPCRLPGRMHWERVFGVKIIAMCAVRERDWMPSETSRTTALLGISGFKFKRGSLALRLAAGLSKTKMACCRMSLDLFVPIVIAKRALSHRQARRGQPMPATKFTPGLTMAHAPFSSGLSRSSIRFAMAQSSTDFCAGRLRAGTHRLAHGQYPETLASLAPRSAEKNSA